MDRFLSWLESTGADIRFYLVLIGAAFVKVLLSERLGFRAALGTWFVAVFLGWVGTDPVMAWLDLSDTYSEVVTVVLALTGEQVARALIIIQSDPEFLKDIIRKRLGGGK